VTVESLEKGLRSLSQFGSLTTEEVTTLFTSWSSSSTSPSGGGGGGSGGGITTSSLEKIVVERIVPVKKAMVVRKRQVAMVWLRDVLVESQGGW